MGGRRLKLMLLIVIALCLAAFKPSRLDAGLVRVGVLGDSLSDEYAFANDPPDRRAAKGYVELLAGAHRLDFGAYSTVSRGEPRNQGYAFDYARSGATSSDLLQAGQATSVAALFKANKVDVAFMLIGGNDFFDAVQSPDPATALQSVGPTLLKNVNAAVATLLASSPNARLVLATLPDIRYTPEARSAQALGLLPKQLVDGASLVLRTFNAAIKQEFAANPRVAIADLQAQLDATEAPATFRFGGLTIDRVNPGTAINNLFVDGVHPGTLGSAGIANEFVGAADARFGLGIRPLSTAEALAAAGGGGGSIAPLPPALWAGAIGLALAAVAVRCGAGRSTART